MTDLLPLELRLCDRSFLDDAPKSRVLSFTAPMAVLDKVDRVLLLACATAVLQEGPEEQAVNFARSELATHPNRVELAELAGTSAPFTR